MSTIERRVARKEKINFVITHLELMLGQWSVASYVFVECEIKLQSSDKDLEMCRKSGVHLHLVFKPSLGILVLYVYLWLIG